MNPLDTARSALTSLWASKLRSSLTVLGIVIGVAAVISLMSIGRGAQASITEMIQSLGTNLLFVQPGASSFGGIFFGQGSASTLTLEDAEAIADSAAIPSVSAVAPQLSTNGQLVYGRENTFTQVLGVTPEYVGVRNLELSTGGFISDGHVVNRSEVIVLGSFVSETLFGLRDPVGQTVKVNGRPFTIIGVLDSMGGGPFGLFRRPGVGAHNHRLLPAGFRTYHPGRRDRQSHQRSDSGRVPDGPGRSANSHSPPSASPGDG